MKYFYKGQLVRTSKNHHYTHAIIRHNEDGTFTCMGCSSSKAGAEKMMNQLSVFQDLKVIKSVQDGTYKKKNSYSNSAEYIKAESIKYYGSIENEIKFYESIIASLEIVEVEEG